MKCYTSVCVLLSLLLWPDVNCWMFSDDYTHRPPDGTLRCYQCDSREPANTRDVCDLNNWKHANITEKRSMIMQCPRRKSAFCHMVLVGTQATVRGCSGMNLADGRTAYLGCFSMQEPGAKEPNRVCLCDTNLCNQANTSSHPDLIISIGMIIIMNFVVNLKHA